MPITSDLALSQATTATPTTGPFLPFCAPWFGPEEKKEILETLDSDWITTGPRTQAFECAFAELLGCHEAVAVSSCTAALHLTLAALGVGAGDAVVTSPFTFAATANVVVHLGAEPVFVDITPDTYNLSVDRLREFFEQQCEWKPKRRELWLRKKHRRVRAIIAVHYAGQPCDMNAINEMARRYGLAVVEDAAHALGAVYCGQKVGKLGDAACFSFYPTKNISTGEGGMLVTDDPQLAQRARMLSQHGISRDAWKRYGREGFWRYDVKEAGYKYNLTDLASALGLHQLRKLSGFLKRRAELVGIYREALAGLPLGHPTVAPNLEPAWHLYAVQVLSELGARDRVIEELRCRNIGASVHFIPLHLTSFYQRAFGYRRGDFPVAEQVFSRIVSLPLFPRMRDEDVHRVARALGEILVR